MHHDVVGVSAVLGERRPLFEMPPEIEVSRKGDTYGRAEV